MNSLIILFTNRCLFQRFHIISGSAYAHANLGTEGHTRIIRYLVNKGANINNFSKNGNTALMFAAR